MSRLLYVCVCFAEKERRETSIASPCYCFPPLFLSFSLLLCALFCNAVPIDDASKYQPFPRLYLSLPYIASCIPRSSSSPFNAIATACDCGCCCVSGVGGWPRFKPVLKRVDRGSQACDTLAKMLVERAAVEGRYSKDLAKWSERWSGKAEKIGAYSTVVQCSTWCGVLALHCISAWTHEIDSMRVRVIAILSAGVRYHPPSASVLQFQLHSNSNSTFFSLVPVHHAPYQRRQRSDARHWVGRINQSCTATGE